MEGFQAGTDSSDGASAAVRDDGHSGCGDGLELRRTPHRDGVLLLVRVGPVAPRRPVAAGADGAPARQPRPHRRQRTAHHRPADGDALRRSLPARRHQTGRSPSSARPRLPHAVDLEPEQRRQFTAEVDGRFQSDPSGTIIPTNILLKYY